MERCGKAPSSQPVTDTDSRITTSYVQRLQRSNLFKDFRFVGSRYASAEAEKGGFVQL
ncbi:hypothetical protein E4U32_003713 [Claviceps aff. humidiphila group G2b]|nr:hypothetical protein E4U32_003713 [Claviceps aff. humidiphila group G2b]